MEESGATIFVYFIILIVSCALFIHLFQYTLMFWFSADPPWYVDGVAGIILCEIFVPAGIITWVLDSCDYQNPLAEDE